MVDRILFLICFVIIAFLICLINYKIEDIYEKMPSRKDVTTYVRTEYVIFNDSAFDVAVEK